MKVILKDEIEEMDRKIDKMVYDLYGLTDDDIYPNTV